MQSILEVEELLRHKVEHELIAMEGRGQGLDGEMDDPMGRDVFAMVLTFLDMHTTTKEA